mmetsp:Transcript_22266/g.62345  ORF Transcript_22266/g.62345 Transcript_22266/m.62345 type:complete len:306 (+) Transcript_22266:237-1154(+)
MRRAFDGSSQIDLWTRRQAQALPAQAAAALGAPVPAESGLRVLAQGAQVVALLAVESVATTAASVAIAGSRSLRSCSPRGSRSSSSAVAPPCSACQAPVQHGSSRIRSASSPSVSERSSDCNVRWSGKSARRGPLSAAVRRTSRSCGSTSSRATRRSRSSGEPSRPRRAPPGENLAWTKSLHGRSARIAVSSSSWINLRERRRTCMASSRPRGKKTVGYGASSAAVATTNAAKTPAALIVGCARRVCRRRTRGRPPPSSPLVALALAKRQTLTKQQQTLKKQHRFLGQTLTPNRCAAAPLATMPL